MSTNLETAFASGQRLFAEQRYDEAVECFERAAEAEAAVSDRHLWLARAYGRKAETAGVWDQLSLAKKVRTHFERAVALDPDNVAARLDLIEFYLAAPAFLGGGVDKARDQAAEIERRDRQQALQARAMIAGAEDGSGSR
jgi:tetratricopeptide (TPR) repeat protein